MVHDHAKQRKLSPANHRAAATPRDAWPLEEAMISRWETGCADSATQAIRWRGQRYWVEFHTVELELGQSGIAWRWRARADFTPAPLSYALLGQRGCLEVLDATFRGADQVVELEMNRAFPGTVRSTS